MPVQLIAPQRGCTLSMIEKQKKVVIIGDRAIAEVAYEYFTHDSYYEVSAFTVEREYLKRDTLLGLPMVPFEDVESVYPPTGHDLFVALGYGQMNRLRSRLFQAAKAKGFALASYVSSSARVWPNTRIGENVFIFESNVIQPFVSIGDNVVLWSGNHVGHHAAIGDHVFVSSHVVIAGYVQVGNHSFLGVNATIADNVTIGRDCLIGAGALVLHDLPPGSLLPATGTKPHALTTYRRFGLSGDE